MESRKNGNKSVQCKVCNKSIRSDHEKRHMGTHKDIMAMTDEEAREELRTRHATELHREERRQEIKEIALQEGIPVDNILSSPTSVLYASKLKESLLDDNQQYLDKIELGNQIASIIDEGVVREESLNRDHKEALDLYRKQMPRIDIHLALLRPWQDQLMKMISNSCSHREIFWICGYNGNEGKSWFQGYLETFYGYARVVRLDLRNKTGNILHTLSKRPLQTTDIFLFNDTRASDHIWQNYTVLEHIKDGSAVSSKYNSTVLTFKSPNLVIVFSNSQPNTAELSRDRWRVYAINKDGLRCMNKGRKMYLSEAEGRAAYEQQFGKTN